MVKSSIFGLENRNFISVFFFYKNKFFLLSFQILLPYLYCQIKTDLHLLISCANRNHPEPDFTGYTI